MMVIASAMCPPKPETIPMALNQGHQPKQSRSRGRPTDPRSMFLTGKVNVRIYMLSLAHA